MAKRCEKRFQAYYTHSPAIVSYMIKLLDLKGEEVVLEPSAGNGDLIDPILKRYANVQVHALELNSVAYEKLKEKYAAFSNVYIKHTDTLLDSDLVSSCEKVRPYDAVIANPPYGAYRTQEERQRLKEKFNDLYTKESYVLFLQQSIKLLKEGGRLVFIIPSTFLHLVSYTRVRKHMLENTKIVEILSFSSSLLPGISFGYAKLSIIALEKCSERSVCINNFFTYTSGYRSAKEFGKIRPKHTTTLRIKQQDVLDTKDHAFLTHPDTRVNKCIKEAFYTIGDLCDCVTGFYSGEDAKYLKALSQEVRNSSRYGIVEQSKITYDCSQVPLEGIGHDKIYIPIVKGANKKGIYMRYLCLDKWFMNWSCESVEFYKKDKKSRYQNARYYFRKGLAVRMIKSGMIAAALIENKLFDQSIVGVFPKDEQMIYYLLAFFNSPTCDQLVHTINPTANNSSNYIKKIPFISPSSRHLDMITQNTKQIIYQIKNAIADDRSLEKRNHTLIEEIYGF